MFRIYNKYFANNENDHLDINQCVICNNIKYKLDYPLISIANAFDCDCDCNIKAHNKCLLNMHKCPTCDKIAIESKLYVETKYDYIFERIFKLVKKNPQLINLMEKICALVSIIALVQYFIFGQTGNNSKKNMILYTFIFVKIIKGFSNLMKNYFIKYWLYDETNGQIQSLHQN